jgi:hypothetical protein
MISKELLLKVLGYTDDCRVLSIKEEYRDIKYDILSPVNGHYTERVNVYELAQICKEWAIGYTVTPEALLLKTHMLHVEVHSFIWSLI